MRCIAEVILSEMYFQSVLIVTACVLVLFL